MSATKLHSVLTGDLVLSERLSKAVRKGIPAHLSQLRDDLATAGVGLSVIDIFRGDGWQVIVRNPADALAAAIYLRAAARSSTLQFDTRVSIGVGGIEEEGSDGVSTGFGEAFTLSGRGLDEMPRDRTLTVRLPPSHQSLGDMVDASFHLLDRLIRGWTPAQARVVAAAIKGRSQEEIGADWPTKPISQQAVGQHLARASWPAIDHMLDAWRRHILHLVGGTE
jgi:hypothetical protein